MFLPARFTSGPSGGARRRTISILRALAVAAALGLPLPGRAGPALPPALDEQELRQPVAEGVTLITRRRFDAEGWLNYFVLEIDRSAEKVSLDTLLGNERLIAPAPLAEPTIRRGAVASVNGDFFHIGTLGTPLSWHIQSGEIVKSAPADRSLAFALPADPEGKPVIERLSFRGTIRTARGAYRHLDGWNKHRLDDDVLIAYNHRWDRNAPGPDWEHLPSDSGPFTFAVLDRGKRVNEVIESSRGPAIPEGGLVLLGRGHGAAWLQDEVRAGDRLTVAPGLGGGAGNIAAAIGGNPVLVRNGEINRALGGPAHPRTAVGFSRDGNTVWLVLVDGRSHLSRGVTLPELAELLHGLGAHEAINLDGGGSSTLLARTPGNATATLANRPSDGGQRSVPNGLGVFSPPGDQRPHHLFLHAPPPPGDYLVEAPELRLAPGTTRRIDISATDSRHGPAELDPGDVSWTVHPDALGHFPEPGLFTATGSGRGKITASWEPDPDIPSRSMAIRVTGEPVRLDVRPGKLYRHPSGTAGISVNAVDADGFRAPLPPEALNWEISGEIGTLENGVFTASATTAAGAILVRYGDLETGIPVGIGGEERTLDDFGNPAAWGVQAVPGETAASLAPEKDPRQEETGGGGLVLDYDFTRTGRTRAAYVRPAEGDRELPGHPLKIGLDVDGDGRGAWLRGHLLDRHGNRHTIDFARNIDWTGRRYVEAPLPGDLDYPVFLRSVYLVEPNAENRYAGTVVFERLTAVSPPAPDPGIIPDAPPFRDPANLSAAAPPADGEIRFAILGGGAVAGVDGATRSLLPDHAIDRINREPVSFTLYTGNPTGESDGPGPDRFDQPFYPAPGGADAGDAATFRETFGPTPRSFVRGHTRFLILDTSRPGLRESGSDQWRWLNAELASVAEAVIVVVTHSPVIDATNGALEGWNDRSEAELLQHRLTRLRDEGKSVYVMAAGPAGFRHHAFDGVSHLVSGGIASRPGDPAFPHYVLATIAEPPDGSDTRRHLTYEVVPLLAAIDIKPSEIRLKPGETVRLRARGHVPGSDRAFPLEYPMNVAWRIEDPEIGSIDPGNGTFRAANPGTTRVAARAGGLNAVARITVISPGPDRAPNPP